MYEDNVPVYYFEMCSNRANVFQRRFFLITQKHFRPTIRFTYFSEVYNSLIVNSNEIKAPQLLQLMYKLCSCSSTQKLEGKFAFDSKKEFKVCMLPYPNFSNEIIKRFENVFVKITLRHFPFRDLDFNYLADVLSGFQLHRETYVTPKEAEVIFYKATFIGHPFVAHFIDSANIFQRGFIYCAANHYGSTIDYVYLVTAFNGLVIDMESNSDLVQLTIDTFHDDDHDFDVIIPMKNNQSFPAEWIVDYYKSSLRSSLMIPERNECHPREVVKEMQIKFIGLTKKYNKQVNYNFATDVINFFRENDKKTAQEVESIFLHSPSTSCIMS